MSEPDYLLTTVKKALALIWRDDQCAVPPGWTTEQDGMVCHAFRSVIRDDRGTVLAEARTGAATAIVTVMNNVNALLARCEAAEAERDEWYERFAQLESHRASCCWRMEQERDAARAEVKRLKAENEKYSAGMQENCALRAEAARLRELLRATCPTCDTVHHAKSDRHDWLEPCPVVARFKAALDTPAREGGEGR